MHQNTTTLDSIFKNNQSRWKYLSVFAAMRPFITQVHNEHKEMDRKSTKESQGKKDGTVPSKDRDGACIASTPLKESGTHSDSNKSSATKSLPAPSVLFLG